MTRVRVAAVAAAAISPAATADDGKPLALRSLAFSPDGAAVAIGADDGTVRLWDPRTGKELARLDVAGP